MSKVEPTNSDALKKVKYKLAAIICHNEEEQEKFYACFEDFFREDLKARNTIIAWKLNEKAEQEQEKQKEQEKGKEKQRKIILRVSLICVIAIVISVLVAIVIHNWSPKRLPALVYQSQPHLIAGEPAEFYAYDTTKSLDDNTPDFEDIYDPKKDSVQWNFGDSTTALNVLQPEHTYSKAGNKKITVKTRLHDQDPEYYDTTVQVCDKLPDLTLLNNSGKVDSIYYLTRSPGDKGKPLVWTIDNDTTFLSTKDTETYKFSEDGFHTISCKYENQFCTHNLNTITVSIKNTFDQYLQIDPDPLTSSLATLTPKPYITTLCFILLLLSGLLPFVWFWLEDHQSKKLTKYYQPSEPEFKNKKPPYNVVFPENRKFIFTEEFYKTWIQHLQQRVGSGQQTLDIDKTIHATILNEGLVTPIFQNKSFKREYLVLIDDSIVNDPQTHLAQHLFNFALFKQVNIEIYYYSNDPSILYKKNEESKTNVRNIQDRYYNSVLIMWGNGYNFLDRYEATVNSELKDLFSYWQKRILITTIPSMDWLFNEEALASFFHLVPADPKGLLEMIYFAGLETYDQPLINTTSFDTYSTDNILFEDINELKLYIGNDALFQCVCALAVYPKLSWSLMLHIVHTVDPKLLTYTNLLKICRIRWIRQNNFPARIRFELLKNLTIDNEIKTRESIVTLLEGLEINEEEYASNEKQQQLLINRFVLYANNPVVYSRYKVHEQEFLKLYRAGKLRDIPFKLYIENDDPDYPLTDEPNERSSWSSPLDPHNLGNKDIKNYVLEKLIPAPVSTINKLLTAFSQLVLAGSLGVLLFLFAGLYTKWPGFQKLVKESEDYSFKIMRDSCYHYFGADAPVDIEVYSDDKQVAHIKDTLHTDYFILKPLPGDYKGKNLEVVYLDSAGIKLTYNGVFSSPEMIIRVMGNCSDIPPPPPPIKPLIYIQCNAPNIANKLNTLRGCLSSFSYTIPPVEYLKNFSRNEIRYFRDSFKDSLAPILNCLKQSFPDKDFKPLKIPGKNTKAAAEIWIHEDATGVACEDEHIINNNKYVFYSGPHSSANAKRRRYIDDIALILKMNPDAYVNITPFVKDAEAQNEVTFSYSIKSLLLSKGAKEDQIKINNPTTQIVNTSLSSSDLFCPKTEVDLIYTTSSSYPTSPKPQPILVKIIITDKNVARQGESFAKELLGNKDYTVAPVEYDFSTPKNAITYSSSSLFEKAHELQKTRDYYFPGPTALVPVFKSDSGQTITFYLSDAENSIKPEPKLINQFKTYLGGGNGEMKYENIELIKSYGIILTRVKSNVVNKTSTFEISAKSANGKPQVFELYMEEEKEFIFKDLKVSIKLIGLENSTGLASTKESQLEIKVYKIK